MYSTTVCAEEFNETSIIIVTAKLPVAFIPHPHAIQRRSNDSATGKLRNDGTDC